MMSSEKKQVPSLNGNLSYFYLPYRKHFKDNSSQVNFQSAPVQTYPSAIFFLYNR